jgi:hypothetical protein
VLTSPRGQHPLRLPLRRNRPPCSQPMGDVIFKDSRFDALRNAIYHAERRSFLDLVNKGLSFLIIILGAGVAGKAARLFHLDDLVLEMGVLVFATIQLVFDLGSRARDHDFLQRRYYEMVAKMEREPKDTPERQRGWSAELVTIAADEPMTMRALDALAYNKALSAIVSDPKTMEDYRQRVTWWQKRCRHLVAFQSAAFPTEKEFASLRKQRWWRRA